MSRNEFKQDDTFDLEWKDFKKALISFGIVILMATTALIMLYAASEYPLAYPNKQEVKK